MVKEQLHRHVLHPAHEIGERKVYRPAALHAAAQCIAQSWQAMDYTV
jgi:hypothetical protein